MVSHSGFLTRQSVANRQVQRLRIGTSARISSTRFSELVMKIQQILARQGIVHTDPEIMSGVPVFVGTRVPLQTFFNYLEGESGLAEFLEDFPHLKTQALQVLEAIALQLTAGYRTYQ